MHKIRHWKLGHEICCMSNYILIRKMDKIMVIEKSIHGNFTIISEFPIVERHLTVYTLLYIYIYIYAHFVVHVDVIKWKHCPRYWPFVRGIHRSPVNSSHKGQWRGALMFSLISARINGWVNNREAGDLRCIRPHNDVTIMACILHIFIYIWKMWVYTSRESTITCWHWWWSWYWWYIAHYIIVT